ncbi:LPS biosynthesis-related glycosyltransferase [Planotetraspora thailandica]|uniref:LPS biosynthesis-related glycosyltransferase n=1 Tax=Planotetraspora thailandica TaxID=487172 RepID=A0A8J3Y2P1_9ACTN|nr:glycosyltransferase family 9 protein [Planotetraspora thailandica]GII59636.1 LPS biosynthesis-related glycosyltransferase [Planotetraspora thailandica]
MTGLFVGGVEHIAVLQPGALADLLLALPGIEALKHAYPAATITVLGRDWHVPFLRGRPGPVDDVIALPPISGVSSAACGFSAPADLVGELRGRRFDIAVRMSGGGGGCDSFVRGLGAALTAGPCAPGFVRLDRWIPYVDHQHETLRSLEVAGLLGAAVVEIEPRIAVVKNDWAELNRRAGRLPKGLVAVNPGAADHRRRWPLERFAEVADRLGRPVVVTGTGPERETVERMTSAMKRPAMVVVDELSLGGMAALYAACDLLISGEGDPRHLAAATGTPTVGIYWCADMLRRGPLTRGHHRPLISWTARSPEPDGEAGPGSWVDDVTVDDVLEQAEDLLR